MFVFRENVKNQSWAHESDHSLKKLSLQKIYSDSKYFREDGSFLLAEIMF